VSQIWQTTDGFMWFETRSGLCQYDGYTVQLFERGTVSVPEKDKELRTRNAEWRREGKGRLTRKGKGGNEKSWQLIPEDIISYTQADHFHVADVDERTEVITTYGSGLYLYDKPTGELTNIKNSVIDTAYLTGLFVDPTGCIWIVEDYLGVVCLRMNGLHYTRHSLVTPTRIQDANHVRCIAPMEKGKLLCSNQMSDIYDYDLANGHASFSKNIGKRIYAAITDKQGNEWIGTRGAGLYKNQQHIEGLSSPNIFQLKEDDKDGIWIAMYEGGIAHLRSNGDMETFLHGKNCHDMVQDEEGNWWVAAEDSIYIIKGDSTFQMIKGFFTCLLCDSNNDIWAGSIGNGLVRCRDGKSYTAKSGLENDNIYSVVQDRQGILWLGTEGGLSCFNPHTKDIQNYHFTDSPLANVFSEHAALVLPDGRLLFGTHDGIIEVNPITDQAKTSPKTVVTGLLVNGTSSEFDAHLSYTDNNLTFLFSNFQYSTLGSVLYQYKLDGIDQEWSQPTKDHRAVYRQLSPGRYSFRVRSNNGKDVWGEDTVIHFVIRQPWWNTWWAWLLYLIAVVMTAWFVIRLLYLHRKLEIERRVSAFKRDFYKRIERELRNPVNVLQGAAENVQLSGTSKTTVQSLRRGSRRMLKLMDMIQHFNDLTPTPDGEESEYVHDGEEIEQRFRDIVSTIHAEEKEFKEMAPPPINAQSILVVEEDEDNLTHLSDTLNPYFHVISCPSMSDCETLIQKELPTLMLLDITTDEKKGRELTTHLKNSYPDLSIIHLSSFNGDTHQLRSLRSGAADYIVKPFSSKVLIERVRKAIVQTAEPIDHQNIHNILTDIKDKKFLDLFEVILAQHISDENFSVESFAELMGLGRTQFYKRVKALTGETPVQHLHRARLEYASRLLCDTTMTIEEVMLRSGFHNPSHFYNAFKKYFGMSPKELRMTHKDISTD
jgi:AraC-like DNA-binding protein/ligand-binding sensor domain-containing protein/signal transduction histidine kinase